MTKDAAKTKFQDPMPRSDLPNCDRNPRRPNGSPTTKPDRNINPPARHTEHHRE